MTYRVMMLVLVMIAGVKSLVQAQELSDLEAVEVSADNLIFDYRLHRNPFFILRNLTLEDSVKEKNHIHLYRGSVIYGGEHLDGKYRNQKHYKLDFQLEPYYNSRFGDVEDPFRTQFGIGPRVEWTSKWGIYGVFQWLLPIQNDFDVEVGEARRKKEIPQDFEEIDDSTKVEKEKSE